ncbi:MAG: NADH-quinone oxidoreductase subunit L, partial [Acidimicrobiia bacterium]
MLDLVWLIPALPLAGFLLLVALGRRLGEPGAGWVATLASAGSFLATVVVFAGLVGEDHHHRSHVVTLFEWLPAGGFSVDLALLADPLSITMALFVTGIGTLIHLYSIGYMQGDASFSKFFVYLNLFVFSMLMLVLGDNLLVTFLGWEGVGTCSYFLISFWFGKDENASAGKKAFVTNRVGDWGFMLAMFLAFATVGSLSYSTLAEEAPAMAPVTATAIALLLFVGACGKSAQLPLFVWLPDAMAGPTPVSALIHAATMVTSGVFLMTRVNPLLAQAYDWAPDVIAWVGVITALFAATIAVAQTDIKKVLAYSTVSQLGYMVMALGVGAWTAGIFHLFTHAFFKGLLFLGAGSVSHAVHGFDMKADMGGLRKSMPTTFATFLIGSLALAGLPPLAGFWSKDEILLGAAENGYRAFEVLGLVGAFMTAAYMTRCVYLTFFGTYRGHGHPHESPPAITVPLVVLAVFSVGAGFLNAPGFELFARITENRVALRAGVPHHTFEVFPAVVSTVVVLAALALGFLLFFQRRLPRGVTRRSGLARAGYGLLAN